MSREEILFLRTMLLDRRSSIQERVQQLAAAWQQLEERAIELEEEAQKVSITKPYDQLDESGKTEIEQIDLALIKMTVGEYGICEVCGDDISPKRLEVLPWARLCVECARDFEKKHKTLPHTAEVAGTGKIPEDLQGLTSEQIVSLVFERLQSEEIIETEDLKIALRKGVLFLDGTVASEREHEAVLQILTDSMGFSSIVDRIEMQDMLLDRDDYTEGGPGRDGLGENLFYDSDLHEDAYESKGTRSFEVL
jgi:DnaK suppressor protein